jgi:tight adherence protein C
MLLILILEIITLAILALFTRDRYESLMSVEPRRNKASEIMLPVSAFIVESIIRGHFHAYERNITAKLSELYSVRDVRVRLLQHLAHKTMNLVVALIALTFLGVLMDKPDAGYMFFASAVLLLVFCIPDRELDGSIKKRNFYIQYDFPDFLNKLVLLINAGMTVPRAWEKIVCDRKDMTPLYEELNRTYIEIKNGKAETAAYEDFARRCRVKEITKFIAAIIQNLRKGNGELVALLKLQSNECWQLRKNMARRLGEEASTKLIFPLMIMFVGILIIVILPAIMQLKYL